jgi:hypothetical protein
MEYRVEQNNPWILLHYSRMIFLDFCHFAIDLTFVIGHLKLILLGLFHMPETVIVHKETEITMGAHLG